MWVRQMGNVAPTNGECVQGLVRQMGKFAPTNREEAGGKQEKSLQKWGSQTALWSGVGEGARELS